MRVRSPVTDDLLREIGRTHHGVVTTRLASAAGIATPVLSHRVRSGLLIKAGYGCYVVTDQRSHLTATAVIQARHPGAVLAGRGAAFLLSLDGLDMKLEPDHVSVARRRSDHHAVVVALCSEDIDQIDGLRVLGPTAVLGTLGLFVSADQLEAATECALRRQLTTEADLHCWLASHDHSGARALAGMMDRRGWGVPPAESYLETLAIQKVLRPQGFSIVRQPVVHTDQGDFLGRFDFEIDGELLLEVSGAAFHATRTGLQRDNWRALSLRLAGREVEHITWDDVTNHPWTTGRRLRQRCRQLAERASAGGAGGSNICSIG